MADNRKLKLRLHAKDPRCHWCKRETKLTNIASLHGKPDPLMATVDHLISRFHPLRWVKVKHGERRRVLACFECNQKRAKAESDSLPRETISDTGRGLCLNPRGKNKAIFHQTVDTVEEAIKKLEAHGIELFRFAPQTENPTMDYKNTGYFGSPALDKELEIV